MQRPITQSLFALSAKEHLRCKVNVLTEKVHNHCSEYISFSDTAQKHLTELQQELYSVWTYYYYVWYQEIIACVCNGYCHLVKIFGINTSMIRRNTSKNLCIIKQSLTKISNQINQQRELFSRPLQSNNSLQPVHLYNFLLALLFYTSYEVVNIHFLVFLPSALLIQFYTLYSENTLHSILILTICAFYFLLCLHFFQLAIVESTLPFTSIDYHVFWFFHYVSLVLLSIYLHNQAYVTKYFRKHVDHLYFSLCSMLSTTFFDWGKFFSVIVSTLDIQFILFSLPQLFTTTPPTTLIYFFTVATLEAVITFFQTLNEELVYRSVLLQLSDSFFIQCVTATIFSCLFGLRHFSSDSIKAIFLLRSSYLIKDLAFFTGFGLGTSILCIKEKGLESAWGIHFSHNYSIIIYQLAYKFITAKYYNTLFNCAPASIHSNRYMIKQSVFSALFQFFTLTCINGAITIGRVYVPRKINAVAKHYFFKPSIFTEKLPHNTLKKLTTKASSQSTKQSFMQLGGLKPF